MSATGTVATDLDRETLLTMYERMMQIRTFEDLAGKNFAGGLIPGFVHLYAGEEAVAVGICSQLSDKDYITSTHRGHGHCIAKGVDIAGMVAELMGKSTGVCKGKGGSMHIADVERGMLGANGIVGGGIPLACGAIGNVAGRAVIANRRGLRVAVVFADEDHWQVPYCG